MIAWWLVGCQLIWSLKDSLGDTGIHFIQQLLHILNTVSKTLQFSSTLVYIFRCTVKKKKKSWLSQCCWQWRWRHMLFIPVCCDLEAWSKYKPWEWQPKTILIPNKWKTISKLWQFLQNVMNGYSRKINKKDDLGTFCVYCSSRTAERLIILGPSP